MRQKSASLVQSFFRDLERQKQTKSIEDLIWPVVERALSDGALFKAAQILMDYKDLAPRRRMWRKSNSASPSCTRRSQRSTFHRAHSLLPRSWQQQQNPFLMQRNRFRLGLVVAPPISDHTWQTALAARPRTTLHRNWRFLSRGSSEWLLSSDRSERPFSSTGGQGTPGVHRKAAGTRAPAIAVRVGVPCRLDAVVFEVQSWEWVLSHLHTFPATAETQRPLLLSAAYRLLRLSCFSKRNPTR